MLTQMTTPTTAMMTQVLSYNMRKRVYLCDRVADKMLDNLADIYGVPREYVVSTLVRLMHRIHFGTRMYPEIQGDFEGYTDVLLALMVEEAAHGGLDCCKINKKVLEKYKDSKVHFIKPEIIHAKSLRIKSDLSEYYANLPLKGSGLNEKGKEY